MLFDVNDRVTIKMKISSLMGTIILTYGISASAFASDTATLTISGRVTEPTCSTDVVNNKCNSGVARHFIFQLLRCCFFKPARGVVTEVVTVPGDTTRQIVLTRYD